MEPHRYQGYSDGSACYVCGLTRENTQMHPLDKYRRILDAIHFGGNIFYDKGRFEAYKIAALLASNLRNGR